MTFLDWLTVVVANGLIVGYGLYLARGTRDSYEWFLAAKGLPWWIVGLSMFATAVDSGDYVAVVGGAYTFGLSNLTAWWLGIPIGWFIVSYAVFLPLYRSGMFTNAEYLEYRFGPGVRVMGALIQIQYRTNVLGNIAFSLYLTFSILTGWGTETWWLVAAIAAAAAAYTAAGGLKSVAVTDALQSIGMFLAALILWVVLWNHVGGWGGIETRLAAFDPALVGSMMHVGGQQQPGVPAWLVVFGWVISLTAYSVVNHSQAMRLLAARSEWDMQMAALIASVIVVIVMGFNITLGLLGRALMPELEMVDQIYPLLVQEYLGPGLVGLVVAGSFSGRYFDLRFHRVLHCGCVYAGYLRAFLRQNTQRQTLFRGFSMGHVGGYCGIVRLHPFREIRDDCVLLALVERRGHSAFYGLHDGNADACPPAVGGCRSGCGNCLWTQLVSGRAVGLGFAGLVG